jgi:UTP--glucose-1-phosphate uridylyltransferase
MSEEGLRAASEKMRADGVADAAIDVFAHYYRELEAGASGMLPEADIEPVADLPRADDLPDPPDGGKDALGRTVMIKLNGGLGTSMGMTRAKSLIEAKEGQTFLDIVVGQVLGLRERFDARVPLVLMNSFATRDDSLEALRRHSEIESDVPLDFLQNKVPKIDAETLQPVAWESDPSLEWAPPGHGDLYTALVTSGMLDTLLEHGYRYAFVSNSDNLGAVLDPRILSWVAREELPFAMEVAGRTEADRKGGHIARLKEGGLVLRETAQTPEEDLASLQDVGRHRYVNTNNFWVGFEALCDTL